MKKGSTQSLTTCVYEIDTSDKIVFCNGGWDAFALENGGEELRFESVKDRSLWEFVTDPSTADLYKRMIAHARKGNPIKFTFRCDSPTLFRLLEMKISLTKTNRVRFSTIPKHTKPKSGDNLLEAVPGKSSDPIVVCSWCGRLNIYRKTWQEIDVAVAKVKLFEQAELPPVSHGICDECLVKMRGVLNEG